MSEITGTASTENTVTTATKARIVRCVRTYASTSRMSAWNDASRLTRTAAGRETRASPPSTVRKLTALIAKHHAMPTCAMTNAASAGPAMRARLKPLELSAIASRKRSRPTKSSTSDWRAGISTAAIVPPKNASPRIQPIVTMPTPGEQPQERRLDQKQRLHDPQQRSTCCSGPPTRRHATRTAKSARSCSTATRPTRNALPVSSSASHANAIACIHDPTSEIVCPTQNNRKFRCVPRTRNGLEAVSDIPMRRARECARAIKHAEPSQQNARMDAVQHKHPLARFR